jgi:hypothetical protein
VRLIVAKVACCLFHDNLLGRFRTGKLLCALREKKSIRYSAVRCSQHRPQCSAMIGSVQADRRCLSGASHPWISLVLCDRDMRFCCRRLFFPAAPEHQSTCFTATLLPICEFEACAVHCMSPTVVCRSVGKM